MQFQQHTHYTHAYAICVCVHIQYICLCSAIKRRKHALGACAFVCHFSYNNIACHSISNSHKCIWTFFRLLLTRTIECESHLLLSYNCIQNKLVYSTCAFYPHTFSNVVSKYTYALLQSIDEAQRQQNINRIWLHTANTYLNALRAAATATWTSAFPDCWTWAMSFPVDGLMVSNCWPDLLLCHSLFMNNYTHPHTNTRDYVSESVSNKPKWKNPMRRNPMPYPSVQHFRCCLRLRHCGKPATLNRCKAATSSRRPEDAQHFECWSCASVCECVFWSQLLSQCLCTSCAMRCEL